MTEQGLGENPSTIDIAAVEAATKAAAVDPTSTAYNSYRYVMILLLAFSVNSQDDIDIYAYSCHSETLYCMNYKMIRTGILV